MSSRPPEPRMVDSPMRDAPMDGDTTAGAQENVIEDFNDKQCIRIVGPSSPTAATFQFEGEDHTLGNALRYIIMKNPDVELCGYSIPHPAEAKMNLRIQTYDDTTAYDALEKGLDDLRDLCGVVLEKFKDAGDDFDAEKES